MMPHVGQRFPGKTMELTLRASLEFAHFMLEPHPSQEDQATKEALTAYAQVSFSLLLLLFLQEVFLFSYVIEMAWSIVNYLFACLSANNGGMFCQKNILSTITHVNIYQHTKNQRFLRYGSNCALSILNNNKCMENGDGCFLKGPCFGYHNNDLDSFQGHGDQSPNYMWPWHL